MGRSIVAKRIKPRDEVTQLAIRVNEIVNAGSEKPVLMRRRAFMRSTRRLSARSARVEAGDERAPMVLDAARIALVLRIELIDVLGVGSVDEVERLHGFKT